MKEFPTLEELQFLVGLRVANVIFMPFSIGIGFDDSSFLVCEDCLEHTDADGKIQVLDIHQRFEVTSLHRIVDRQIVSIRRSPFTLTLVFEDNQAVNIISVKGPYESGNLTHNGSILVF
jgi:hypothetical protein